MGWKRCSVRLKVKYLAHRMPSWRLKFSQSGCQGGWVEMIYSTFQTKVRLGSLSTLTLCVFEQIFVLVTAFYNPFYNSVGFDEWLYTFTERPPVCTVKSWSSKIKFVILRYWWWEWVRRRKGVDLRFLQTYVPLKFIFTSFLFRNSLRVHLFTKQTKTKQK